MKWKDFLKDYLSFSKKDRIGVLFLVLLILSIYLLPRFFSPPDSSFVHPDSALLAAIDTLKTAETREVEKHNYDEQSDYTSASKTARFSFDPNTLDSEGWIRLGLSQKCARTIQNYLSKGGHFNKPEDLSKIWGLPPGFYESVKDYMVLENKSHQSQRPMYTSYPASQSHLRIARTVNINEGDSSSFEALPGIGGKLAARIEVFREKLGGFYSIEQVGETYGLPDSTFQKIRPLLKVSGEVKKININTATKDELKNHPYIRWKLANAIVEYRNQHGNFNSVEDLKKIVLIDDADFEKIRHYVVVGE